MSDLSTAALLLVDRHVEAGDGDSAAGRRPGRSTSHTGVRGLFFAELPVPSPPTAVVTL